MTLLRRIHLIAGITGLAVILTFWSSTIMAELFGSTGTIVAVKRAIPWGFIVLIPCLVIAGASGFFMSRHSQDARILRKKRRMAIIAMNGLLVLVPAALYLAFLAARGDINRTFYLVQSVELVAGAINIILMSLNVHNGLQLTGRIHRSTV